jgi:hypothetical protein
MARTAITELQQQIEAVRREAFAAGYAAAMEAIRELTSRAAAPGTRSAAATPSRRGRGRGRGRARTRQAAPAAKATPARRRRTRTTRTARAATATARTRRPAARRPQRGTNARMIEEILKAAAPRAIPPAEIRKALQDNGVAMAFTSIRHALGQLEQRNAAEQVGDSRTWRHRGGTS